MKEVKKYHPGIPSKRHRLGRRCAFLVMAFLVYLAVPNIVNAQTRKPNVEVTIIETEVGYHQMKKNTPADTPGQGGVDDLREVEARPTSSSAKRPDYDISPPPPESVKPSYLQGRQLREEQIIQLNNSLRQAIERNEGLIRSSNQLDREIRSFRGQRNIDANRINSLRLERDAYKQQSERVLRLKEEVEVLVEDLKFQAQIRQRDLENKIRELETQLAQEGAAGGELSPAEAGPGVAAVPSSSAQRQATATITDPSQPVSPMAVIEAAGDQSRGMDVMAMLESINKEQEKMKMDEARMHYNMGNIYFNQGKFKRALKEFTRAVRLSPQDFNAHFNLAFVSGEYLNDPDTAIKHYRKYLYLNPQADDAGLVYEKILDAEIALKTRLNSSLERDLQKHRNRLNKM